MFKITTLFAIFITMTECKYLLVETNDGKGIDMKDNCACERTYMPVCGEDGETHANTCNAGCAGTEVKCGGECPCSPLRSLQIFENSN